MESIAAKPMLPSLESHLGYWLRRVSNAVSGAFTRHLQEKQTSVAEWVFLRELHDCGQSTPGEMAGVLGLTPGAVSKIVDKLELKNWLSAAAKASDNRVRLLSLSREGRRSLPVLAKIADNNDAQFFDCLSPTERETLRALLTKVARHHGIHDIPTE